ncbi:MAG: DNA polymerase, partial [Clostridia bacterium]
MMQVLTEGPLDAQIMLVGEAPGEQEDRSGKPFVGSAGKILDNLLAQAGIARYQCLITNVARERPPANKISFFFEDKHCTVPKPKLQAWINKLKEEITTYNPNIVIALGATALWALTGKKKISEYRGYVLPCSLVPGKKIIATYHPQAVGYEWKLFYQTVLDLRKAFRHSKFPHIPECKQVVVPGADIRQFITYMEELIAHPEWDKLSVDIETIQPGSHIEELGISHDPNFGMSIFLIKGRAPALPEKDELLLWQTFARLVACKKVVMQNAAYDIGVLWYNQHILVENLWMDTLIAAHVCWPELPRDLGFLGSICLDVPPWKVKGARTSEYNPLDAANTLGIAYVLEREIEKQGIKHTFDFEMNLIPVALTMQLQGIGVDREKQKELIETHSAKRAELKRQLDTVLGREVNFSSPKQMQQLLYMDLKLPVQYKRRKSVNDPRTMTTDANALRTLSRLVPDNPIFNLILDYKKEDMLINNFLEIELSPENKVHTSYNITGASSDDEEDTKKTKRSFGRWSSSASIILPYGSGNLQNIPPEARKMYRAPKGWKIIQADYSQAEAVVMAYLTGDHKLKKMFRDSFGLSGSEKKVLGYDIHKMTFAQMAGIDVSQVTKEQRQAGKTVRHATNYCVDDKTEVLTQSGWKPIYLISSNIDMVAQWSPSEEIKFVYPSDLYKFSYKGQMFLIENMYTSQCITENHRVPVINRKTKILKTLLSQDIFYMNNSDYQYPVSGKLDNTSSITPDFIRLFVALQADGSFRERDRGRKEISFTIKKDRKIDRLIELLTTNEIKFSTYDTSDNRIGFYING